MKPSAIFSKLWTSKCSSFRSDLGNVAVSLSLALPALLGATGLAIDYGQLNSKRSSLQSAADSAAIAGAKEYALAGSSPKSIEEAATLYAKASSTADLATAVAVNEKTNAVTVELREEWTPAFAHFIGVEMTPIVVQATAALTGVGNICVLALDKEASQTLMMDNKSLLTGMGCGVYVNSKSIAAITLNNSSIVKANMTCVVGDVFNKGMIVPEAVTDCPVLEDPLNGRNGPKVGACDYTNTVIGSGSVNLYPGVYCGGISIGGKAVVNAKPGTYVVKDGPLSMSGSAILSGTNVGFFLTGPNALISFQGNTTIDLSGSEAGDMAGLLFFADRNNSAIAEHIIRSTNAHTLTGTIYLPNGNLRIDPGAKVGQNSAYTAIIANKLVIDKGPELILNSDYGATDVPVPEGIKLSSQVVLTD